ncbi:MAG: tryptophan 7-halogenase [Sphingomonadales bacterium]|nr:MAG: tryptophan 7-halogenase [Sphingomonadales bacterium]
MSDGPIRSVCVVGNGIVALSAAAAFARALPGVALHIVETPPDPTALADTPCASLPSIHHFHAAIGLDEAALLGEGAATHLLGTRFAGWSASGSPWIHAFGEHGLNAGEVPFHMLWHRARIAGRAAPFHCHSAAATLAAADKFVHPSADPASPLAGFLYGLRLERVAYGNRLGTLTADIPHRTFLAAERDMRGIAALRLTDGTAITADLYLDCTGPQALLRASLDPEFEPWDAWLPCDHIRFGAGSDAPLSPLDRVEAQPNGWRRTSSRPGHVRTVQAWSSRFADTGQEPAVIAIRPGRRPCPWAGNVLALGDAATALDPLYGAPLHLAQAGILLALELLPGRGNSPIALAEYNRRFAEEALGVRDFLALHYVRSGRSEPFWTEAAGQKLPASLARIVEQFERRGRIPPSEAEGVDRESWIAALIGLGVEPGTVNPLADSVDPDKAAAAIDALAGRIAAIPAGVPPYPEYLARMRAGGR